MSGMDEAVDAAREAVVRTHHEAFRAGLASAGLGTPLPFDELSDRIKRLKHQQLDPHADVAVEAAGPLIAAAVRADVLREERAKSEYRVMVDRPDRPSEEPSQWSAPTSSVADVLNSCQNAIDNGYVPWVEVRSLWQRVAVESLTAEAPDA